jgi:hypothetical protein
MISRSVESVVLSRPDGRLSDDQQFVDLAIAQLVVVGVAVTSPKKQNENMENDYKVKLHYVE